MSRTRSPTASSTSCSVRSSARFLRRRHREGASNVPTRATRHFVLDITPAPEGGACASTIADAACGERSQSLHCCFEAIRCLDAPARAVLLQNAHRPMVTFFHRNDGVGMNQVERRESNRDPKDELLPEILALLRSCGAEIRESDRQRLR